MIYRFIGISNVLSLLIALLSLVCKDSASGGEHDFHEFDRFVEAELERERCPGASIAIVLGDQVIYSKGYGLANVETLTPVTTEMLFRLGSTTKMFTAAGLLMLVEEGKIQLHKPIGENLQGLDPSIARLTPHQLLSHTSGLADPNSMDGPHDETALESKVKALSDSDIFEASDTIYSYSNAGYWTAGFMIQNASNELYADFLNNHLLRPLGMKQSTFRPTVAMTWPLAVGHGPEDRSPPRVIRPLADNSATWPAGQLFSSAPEFSRFLMAFMNNGELDGRPILSKFVLNEMSKLHVAVPNENLHYGYGLSIRDVQGLRWLSHSGSRTGYGSHARMCPEKKFAVVILTNKTGVSLNPVASYATSVVLGVETEPTIASNKMALSSEELPRYSGVYANGSSRIVLAVRNNALYCEKNRLVTKVGKRSFVAKASKEAPSINFSMVLDEEGNPKYLLLRGRAYKRQSIDTSR